MLSGGVFNVYRYNTYYLSRQQRSRTGHLSFMVTKSLHFTSTSVILTLSRLLKLKDIYCNQAPLVAQW